MTPRPEGDAFPVARPRLRLATAATFAAFLDIFALLPLLAPTAAGLGAGDVGIGVTVAAYSATGMVGNLFGGRLADRLGRRGIATSGLVLAAAGLASYPLAGTLAVLVAVRLVHGLGGGLAMPALFAAAGDAGHAGGRAVAMGRLGATIGLAAVVAPGTAGAAAAVVGADAVFLTVAGLLVGAALLALGLPGRAAIAAGPGRHGASVTAGADPDGTAVTAGAGPDGTASPADGRPEPDEEGGAEAAVSTPGGRGAAMTAVFGFTAALGTLTGFLPETLAARGAGDAVPGALLTAFSLVAVAVMLSPAMRRIDPAAPAVPLGGGVGVIAVALAALAAPVGIVGAAVAVLAIGSGFGAVFPAAAATMAATPDVQRGRAFGRFHVAYGLGFVAGPPGAGALGQAVQASPFVPAAVVAAVCAAVAWWVARRG